MQEPGLKLKQAEKEALDVLMRRGRQSVRVLKRARALQLLGEGWTGVAAAEAAGLSERTVRHVRGRYRCEGLEAALREKPRPGRQRRSTPSQVVALVCSNPPQGYGRWTLSLLVREVVGRGIVPQVGMETVRELIKRHDLKPWREKRWCVPQLDAQYVQRMEDVLDLYEKPFTRREPVVCFDERLVQLLDSKRDVRPMHPGAVTRRDFEYVRCGTANLFCAVEPRTGRHFVKATRCRKAADFAQAVRDLARRYPNAR
ncbi:IS630 family transposase [Corallococcus exercitus]|uniref:IS630 family transposase n=1 Tax=Corallococcus exercitus TaxID=2316736 RepID=A0A7Y4JRD5_9BACT|nr:IS630 family transposase [Corallococcus exercitus]